MLDLIYTSGNPASFNFFLDNVVRFLEVSYPAHQEAGCLHDYLHVFQRFLFLLLLPEYPNYCYPPNISCVTSAHWRQAASAAVTDSNI